MSPNCDRGFGACCGSARTAARQRRLACARFFKRQLLAASRSPAAAAAGQSISTEGVQAARAAAVSAAAPVAGPLMRIAATRKRQGVCMLGWAVSFPARPFR